MDALPDELLLLILGHLDDGLVLLDAVPLVCKRWHRVSRDPRAWAGVDVDVEGCRRGNACDYCDPDHLNNTIVNYLDASDSADSEQEDYVFEWVRRRRHRRMAVAARLVLRAPFLRRLRINWSDGMLGDKHERPYRCAYEKRTVWSALRRSGAAVGALHLPQPLLLTAPATYPDADDEDGGAGVFWQSLAALAALDAADVDGLAALLTRSRRSLRALRLGQLLAHEKLELAVSQLGGLRRLSLVLDKQQCGYTGSLAGAALPNLVWLYVACPVNLYKSPAAVALLVDLVGGAAGSLRVLRFSKWVPLPPAVAAEVRRCEGLRELSCGVADAGLLPALPRLSALRLELSRTARRRYDDEAVVLAAAAEALLEAAPLASLSRLHVTVQWPSRHSGRLSELRARVTAVLEALATASPGVTSLDLLVTVPKLSVGGFLERLRALRSVKLRDRAIASGLVAVSGLPALAALTLGLDVDKKATQASRLPAMDEEAAEGLTYGDVLGRMRRVRSLSLHGCFPDALPVLAGLAKLRALRATLWVKRTAAGRVDIEAATADFKRRRPDVRADFAYH